jgi:hypothetical protein
MCQELPGWGPAGRPTATGVCRIRASHPGWRGRASFPKRPLPGATFSVWHNVCGAVLTAYWRRRGTPALGDGEPIRLPLPSKRRRGTPATRRRTPYPSQATPSPFPSRPDR